MNKEITPRCGVLEHRLSEGSVEEGVVSGSGGEVCRGLALRGGLLGAEKTVRRVLLVVVSR
ncbi:hypothetical protein E2C01_035219 [Portunus trituberculatus]|uniref:Uncharacterized protein n=1 Tax=Portunus trituberculatus TaxID=210409 RepID=A0A5B7F960_PORTR|nr:hypothetical protein [Portunus trituberculatus]